jgi:thymidylate synthase ThyX
VTHAAKILADSVSPDGVRLTTFEITFPRIVLAEFNTHRVFSRNSASSRAIPVEKMIRMVEEHPYVPTHWGKNQKGMQAEWEVSPREVECATERWLLASEDAIKRAWELLDLGIHKQITNRLLEPFMWHTVIVTATEWSNFFHLRDNTAAHPEIAKIARMMRELYEAADPAAEQASDGPNLVTYEDWHLPLVEPGEAFDLQVSGKIDPKKVSVGRCARVSYLTHDGKRDPEEDVKLCDRLLASGHMSPFEHVARPATDEDVGPPYADNPRYLFRGNFRGWVQYRKEIPHEDDILAPR